MQVHEVCGYVASVLFTVSLIPQIIRVFKLKRSDQISPMFIVYSMAACSLMLVYSYVEGAWPVVLNNAGCLGLNLVLACAALRYKTSGEGSSVQPAHNL